MAKQRKQKQKEAQGDATAAAAAAAKPGAGTLNSCAVVRHQKLCLAIDIEQQWICGHTELQVMVPANGIIGLHAKGLQIEQVLFQGSPAKFELSSRKQCLEKQSLSNTYNYTASDAADAAFSKYVSNLEEESHPELLIYSRESTSGDNEAPSCAIPVFDGEAAVKESITSNKQADETKNPLEKVEEVKLVRIEYSVELPSAGAHFMGNTLHTHNQLRRARCWFPCADSIFHRCSYHLEFTVNSNYIAVSSGKLLYQIFSTEDRHLKTFVYSLEIPTAASFISLVVAPLIILPDRQNSLLSHMCMPGKTSQLQCSVSFFHSVFSFYEDYLGSPFPFGCYKQVFIDPEVSSMFVGASVAIFSSHLLVDERIIDQAITTRIKLAYALAQQWFGVFITPDTTNDAWLLEGLPGFLLNLYIKRHFGNNEACYRQFKSNEAVTMVDVEGAPPLSPPTNRPVEAYGTEKLGFWGKIRSWKAVAVLQMLEKQMGPEPFRKILQRIILKAQDPARQSRTLSTKEVLYPNSFRHFANKIGNLERPFLKEFFPRWVESPGCPLLKMGFAYNKRRNMVELAVHRGCTADLSTLVGAGSVEGGPRAIDVGWPGMMSIRLHELDGMYDHPSLPMAGDTYQLLELQCHTKLAGRRLQKPKKGSKLDAVDENVELAPAVSVESPLLWLRADPGQEYLARIQLNQPEHMWINQLEKDRDVVAQVLAIYALKSLPHSFSVVNALHNCLSDAKIFCRVRIEAASALASTASEVTGWAGLAHLIKFYKSRRFDPEIGLPRSNDFHDLSEYFVLEAIPMAIATVRGSDERSPIEAVEFIRYILKHNDNTGNAFSDTYWLASVIEAAGTLEFGTQSLENLAQILKQIDRFLQYDRIIPSYNCILTISCIRTLTRLGLKFSSILPVTPLEQILSPFKQADCTPWRVRVVALQAFLDITHHTQGLDAALSLTLRLIQEENCLLVQNKLMAYSLRICLSDGPASTSIDRATTNALLDLLCSELADRNTLLRHYVFALLQVLGGRPASLLRLGHHQKPVTASMALDQVPPQKVSPQPVRKEVKVKVSSLKVRIPRPPEPKGESLRIRVVPFGPSTVKEADIVGSTSSGGKREDDQKIGVVKLRLKPKSSTNKAIVEDSNAHCNEGFEGAISLVLETTEAFPVSAGVLDESLKESPHSQKEGSSGSVQREIDHSNASVGLSSHLRQSPGVQTKPRMRNVVDESEPIKMKSIEEIGGRIQITVRPSSHQNVHVSDPSVADQQPTGALQELAETESSHDLRRIGGGLESEKLHGRTKEKKDKKHKDKKRKREKERDDPDHREKRRDKRDKNDPDHKEKRRDKDDPDHQEKRSEKHEKDEPDFQEKKLDNPEKTDSPCQEKRQVKSEKNDTDYREKRRDNHEKNDSHSHDKRRDKNDPEYRARKRLKKGTGNDELGYQLEKGDQKQNRESSEPTIAYSEKKQPESTSDFVVRLKVKR
ncbi:hypothetical protein O6H91_02G064000 [Diphasiastrum complanatum]|uniref:Uncharacterized protein n=1 Tax=Diphasiastrum complanatum TaxID=34168 RepID=A0ACC2EG54_DIPCM|nr:hypothetical protein O6H91_02G064000 [Diphasiastrum complanatum]